MFNQENPFEGSDGFTHLLYRPALVSQLQHNSHKYRYFSNQTKNLFTKNIPDTKSSDEDVVKNKDQGEMGDKMKAKESLNQMVNVPEKGIESLPFISPRYENNISARKRSIKERKLSLSTAKKQISFKIQLPSDKLPRRQLRNKYTTSTYESQAVLPPLIFSCPNLGKLWNITIAYDPWTCKILRLKSTALRVISGGLKTLKLGNVGGGIKRFRLLHWLQ